MTARLRVMLLSLLGIAGAGKCAAQKLDEAEVRLPYGELKALLDAARDREAKAGKNRRAPALLGTNLVIGVRDGALAIEAVFKVASFSDDPETIGLLGGGIALEAIDPADAVVVALENGFGYAVEGSGKHAVKLKLVPDGDGKGCEIDLKPCASITVEVGDLPEGCAIGLTAGGRDGVLRKGDRRVLPTAGGKLAVGLLTEAETRAALRPPEVSVWSWQQQLLVTPEDDALAYLAVCRASAAGGSGIGARLELPPDARDIRVEGADLAGHRIERGENRRQTLVLDWRTRDVLDRRMVLEYRIAQPPLDARWKLRAPGDDATRARFVLTSDPLLAYAAENLSPPRQAAGLPLELVKRIGSTPCVILESGSSAEIAVTRVPVAATAEGEIVRAEWEHRIEPDGAMLTRGKLTIGHRGAFALTLDTPGDMKLLSCEVGGRAVQPVDLGKGLLKIALPPPGDEPTGVEIAFTGRLSEPIDPVSGTLQLTLPVTATFIHGLDWRIELPSGYQAETHGNLQRVTAGAAAGPSKILLTKKLCREERPDIRVFYQRSGLGNPVP